MKTKLLLLFLMISLSTRCLSQDLEGEWIGTFTTDIPPVGGWPFIETTPFMLNFINKPDSMFTGYSYTLIRNASDEKELIVCLIKYELLPGNQVIVEEVRQLGQINPYAGLQKMHLKLRIYKKRQELTGTWKHSDPKFNNSSAGTVQLKKVN
jgi:hypothetical protein